ncbi:MAG: maleylpyruvate isomerase family mycothiol-dependent enzyme [Acidimicrobiales bacterium]|nr:maleylpyruvate isomerase family mycothiol-dependent enzyme [Acidimicrobiales bacterium]
MTFQLSDYVDAHRGLFAHYNDLAGRLSDDEMATQSLCPDWDVRGVITHTLGVEVVLTGWEPSAEAPPPFEKMGAFEAEAAALSRADFAIRVQEVTATRLAELERLDASVIDQPSITPTGIGTYGGFLQVRVFDLWVHARDIAVPLGESLDDAGPAAEMALSEVDGAVGYIVGKKIGLPEGKSVVFEIRGDIERDIAVTVDGRATRVERVDEPDVVVTTDVGTFIMLAAGRIDPHQQLDAGTISWSGDEEWGPKAALNLAYTR